LPRSRDISIDPLLSFVPLRSVDRRCYRLRALTTEQRRALAASLGESVEIEWHETPSKRWRIARLGGRATAVRLSAPETFPIHQRVIDWDRALSPTGIPAGAAGLARSTLWLMRWAMKSWDRMRLLNRLGGTITAALQMDYLPGFFSAAFFGLRVKALPEDPTAKTVSLIDAGRSIQRFWLMATRLGLTLQPNMATLIFAHYGRNEPTFTADARTRQRAGVLGNAAQAEIAVGPDLVFLGRIGTPWTRAKRCRSVRLPLSALLRRSG
jgi:hypothetical protein